MSQDELAEKSGVAISSIKDIERGIAEGYLQTRQDLIEVIGCSMADLYSTTSPERSVKPSPLNLKRLIDSAADDLPHTAMAMMNAEFLRAEPGIRAAVLAVLYDDDSIVAPYLSKAAKLPKAR